MPEGLPEEGGGGTPPLNPAAPRPSPDSAWRDRALRAEAQVQELTRKLEQAGAELAKSHTALADLRADAELDRAVQASHPVDPDIARTLVKDAVAKGAKSSAEALTTLKRTKPFLFRALDRPSSMSPDAPFTGQPQAPSLAELADAARAGNDRRSLLSYLRAKRNP